MTAFLRLGFAVLLFALSLLAVFRAPTYDLWKASIGVTELGHVLALFSLLVFLPGWRKSGTGRAAAVTAIAAMALFLSPIIRAVSVATGTPARLTAAFGNAQPRSLPGAPPREKPLALASLLRKPPAPEVRVEKVTYVLRDGKPLELDLYRRDRSIAAAPLVMTIHGGSWIGGSRSDLAELNYYLAARGYVVAAVSYRLAPMNVHPAQTDDVNAAIEYLAANASAFGIDRTRIALIGRSAGGQLALLSGYTKNDSSIRGVVAFYAPTDQKWGWDNPSDPRVYDSFATLRNFLGGDPSARGESYYTSSPINYVGPRTVPTLLIHGSRDELVSARQSARLDSALAAAGRPHLYLELPWATHGCDFIFVGPCAQISTYSIERFLGAIF